MRLVMKKRRELWLRIPCAVLFTILIQSLIIRCYLDVYYRMDENVQSSMESTDTVSVTRIRQGFFFDGAGTRQVLVFYPGAKVQSEAYAPLMKELAERGLDCFLMDPPGHFILLDQNAFERAYESASCENWYIGGHSLGGICASSYAASHPDRIRGVILLASYPIQQIDETLLLISGSEDRILNRNQYERSRKYWPAQAEEYVIAGGNHSGFASYGIQDSDGKSLIPPEEQLHETADRILSFVSLDTQARTENSAP